MIPRRISPCITRNIDTVPLFNTRPTFYINSFYPSTTVEWNNLDQVLRYYEAFTLFRCNILKFIRPPPNSFLNCQNIGLCFATRLCLGLSHFREHKSKYSFQDALNSLSNFGTDVRSFFHFLLQYPFFNERCTFTSNFNKNEPLYIF